VTWIWDFGDGESSGEQEPMHVYSTSGKYMVTLTATSSEGCETSITKTIGIVTGVETELERAIKLYPNPVNDKRLIVDCSEINEKVALNFFSVDGKLLYRRIILPGNEGNVLDLSGFAPGSYVVQVIFSTGTVVRKIVISY
jgi:PKD repeat protein